MEPPPLKQTVIRFSGTISPSDPLEKPVLIVGQMKNLTKIKYDLLKQKLEPRVDQETYTAALRGIHPSSNDTVLTIHLVTLAALPFKCSRHNSPARPHSLTKIVQSHTSGVDEYIVVVCERDDVFASACAIARAFPLYSRKTQRNGLAQCPRAANKTANANAIATATASHTVTVEFVVVGGDSAAGDVSPLSDADLASLDAVCNGIRLAARIVDMPCNEMNVDHFLKEVESVSKELPGVSMTVIRGEELAEKGFGGIYGVGKAALVPPALAVLSHTPPQAQQTIAWVGKGIVYDTGGLSIKGKTMMPGMKRDCGGAAAILGAFQAMVRQGFTQNLHAVFCLAENAVGPLATRPDDIHTLYSGRTVEINNTDAEGRLVLSDGVVYARCDLAADVILDMATLTGAQGMATGKYHGAVLTNSQDWEETAVRAGLVSGDLLFPIPYSPELHFPEYASAVADMKNSVADRSNALSSCAGLFIAAHLGFEFPGSWIHIDMASPVKSGERATGYGVALLASLFGSHSKDQLLKTIGTGVFGDTFENGNGSASKKLRRK
ncbi:probable aminopeptidase NPEPL1 isoform X2 [Nilaparvata lugens]|nr:probable aminopeptidase NPEPL1 isoform X2 [Nilaparvata lugens]XP_022185742.2 probable aminopeptidase NPEPL1 isoform X2 [Nilaparvata lugens]